MNALESPMNSPPMANLLPQLILTNEPLALNHPEWHTTHQVHARLVNIRKICLEVSVV